MTKWLERQEAIRKQNAYLDWLNISDQNPKEHEPTSHFRQQRYKIAKHPSYPQTTVISLTERFGAVDFLLRLHDFFKKTLPPNSFHIPTICSSTLRYCASYQ